MQAGDTCTTGDGKSGFYLASGREDGGLICVAGDTLEAAQAAHASASNDTAPINTTESISDRIARIKSETKSTSDNPDAGLTEVKENTSTTAGSARQDRSDPQRVASGARGSATAAAPGSTGEGADKSITHAEAGAALGTGETEGRISDGSATGERVRQTTTGTIPESNDVMLGDQSSRKDGPKDSPSAPELKADGSKSPHDVTSEGSRQEAAHQQELARRSAVDEAGDNPAFRAEAKARTI